MSRARRIIGLASWCALVAFCAVELSGGRASATRLACAAVVIACGIFAIFLLATGRRPRWARLILGRRATRSGPD